MYDPISPMLRPAVTEDGPPAPDAKARFAEDRLLDAVIWCEIAPGEIVTEADMMERFGLTRAAARSGLVRLGYDGWAAPQPRTGWLILSVSGALIGQVFAARRIVEPALATAILDDEARANIKQIGNVLTALDGCDTAGAMSSYRHYVDSIDGLLLQAIDPFTARHLRKLWHHTARITHFLEDVGAGRLFHRTDALTLIRAVLANDSDGIVNARHLLIDAQEAFFIKQLLRDNTPLKPVQKNHHSNVHSRKLRSDSFPTEPKTQINLNNRREA